MPRPSTIAIDGPAASGKSTVGAILAARLGYICLDTGVMYRAVAWAAFREGVDADDEVEVKSLAERLHVDVLCPTTADGRRCTVLVDGQDITSELRKAEVEERVSPISAYLSVRAALTAQQRRIGAGGRVVMVGRDIGTVVLPEADLKIYLDATLEERVMRRYREVLEREGVADYGLVWRSVEERDRIDSSRALAPLEPAADAVKLDTTHMAIPEVIERVWALVEAWQPSRRSEGTPSEDFGVPVPDPDPAPNTE